MKRSAKYYVVVFTCLVMVLGSFGGCAQDADKTQDTDNVQEADKNSTISDAERALAILEVQNVMSKHAYYHANGMHEEEMLTIWVNKDGKYAKDCHFANPEYIMDGYDVTWKNYGVGREDREQKSLDAITKIYPEIENIPENRGIGHEWAMHTQTTPIIVVAEDGQTAKGVWYSPGIGLFPQVKDGKITVRGTFFWEMYGVDFAKEEGQWKIWHLQTFYDYTPSLPASMTENLVQGAPAAVESEGEEVEPERAEPTVESMETAQTSLPEGYIPNNLNAVTHEKWSPTRKPVMVPRLPEPYTTFSETFSY